LSKPKLIKSCRAEEEEEEEEEEEGEGGEGEEEEEKEKEEELPNHFLKFTIGFSYVGLFSKLKLAGLLVYRNFTSHTYLENGKTQIPCSQSDT
jgi:hypothetical protein